MEKSDKIQLPRSVQLSAVQFNKISNITHRLCGVNLHSGKEELVRSRLIKRLRALRLDNFEKYIEYVEQDRTGRELSKMIDALTTNKTDFFREPEHFEFLIKKILRQKNNGSMRIWSAGCSSGEEPYSIAIALHEGISNITRQDARILATDISVSMLERARKAIYAKGILERVQPLLLQKYFTCVRFRQPRLYQVNDQIRSLVKFAQLNLMSNWPMKGPFDIIFCRNVMIYFDRPTQYKLILRFWHLLKSGGYLFVGHSESLTVLSHPFQYIQPAVYMKQGV